MLREDERIWLQEVLPHEGRPHHPHGWIRDTHANYVARQCAWSFSPNNGGLVTLSNNSRWKLRGERSNAAYTAGTGYANGSGQHGCLPFDRGGMSVLGCTGARPRVASGA